VLGLHLEISDSFPRLFPRFAFATPAKPRIKQRRLPRQEYSRVSGNAHGSQSLVEVPVSSWSGTCPPCPADTPAASHLAPWRHVSTLPPHLAQSIDCHMLKGVSGSALPTRGGDIPSGSVGTVAGWSCRRASTYLSPRLCSHRLYNFLQMSLDDAVALGVERDRADGRPVACLA
jgi:hypothetical protein